MADVEELLAERGVMVSREAICGGANRFGTQFAACIRRDRPQSDQNWHDDEVLIPRRGVKQWLWRAVDANDGVLNILVQVRRNAKAESHFLARLISQFVKPKVVVSDKAGTLYYVDCSSSTRRQSSRAQRPQKQD